jgi:putative ABC transport system ATP-binding protein
LNTPIIHLNNVSKSYNTGKEIELKVLENVNLEITKSDFTAIVGPSGSGKSTLLYLIAGIDSPEIGNIIVNGQNLTKRGETWLADFRSKNIGFIYQFFGLLPTLTALENVMLPLSFQKIKSNIALERAKDLLDQIGLSDRFDHRPNSLSGGEMQRVAIARALATNPPIVLADEPTGNLDQKTGKSLLKILLDLVEDHGTTLVTVTHDLGIAKLAKSILQLGDGNLIQTHFE